MEKKLVTGIDIGSSYIKVLVARVIKTEDGESIKILGANITQSHGVSYGVIVNKDKLKQSLSKAIKDTEKKLDVRINEAYITISDPKVKSFSKSTHKDTRDPMIITESMLQNSEDVAKDAAEEANPNDHILDIFTLSYILDGENVGIDPIDLKFKSYFEANYLFVSCFSKNYDRLLEAVEPVIEVLGVVPASVAISNFLTEEQKLIGSIAINFGGDTTNVAIWKNGLPISLKTIERGGNDITKQITVAKNIEMREAEKLKKENLENEDPEVTRIIGGELKEILSEVKNIIKNVDKHLIFPGGVLISGGMVSDEKTCEFVSDQIGLPTFISKGKEIVSGKKVPFPFWGSVYGLILHAQYDDSLLKTSMSLKRIFNRILRKFHLVSKSIS